jgi:hypothetical protein
MGPFEPIPISQINYDSASLFHLSIVILYFYFLHYMLKRRERRAMAEDQVEKIDVISI